MHSSLGEMININNIISDISDKCRSIINKHKIGNIYLGKYKENKFKCENIE